MLVTRWEAPRLPNVQQIETMFKREGLSPFKDILIPKMEIPTHSHPFDEIRMIASGKLIMDITGNRFLLYPGDRIVIPSNTKHSKQVEGEENCVCICANKVQ